MYSPERQREYMRAYNRKRREDQPEKVKAERRAHYLRNKPKYRENAIRWQKNNPERYREVSQEQYKRNRVAWDQVIESRGMNKCSICGYKKCLSAIEFHHLDPSKKEYKINVLRLYKITSERLAELDKCIALCANCHREIHEQMRLAVL